MYNKFIGQSIYTNCTLSISIRYQCLSLSISSRYQISVQCSAGLLRPSRPPPGTVSGGGRDRCGGGGTVPGGRGVEGWCDGTGRYSGSSGRYSVGMARYSVGKARHRHGGGVATGVPRTCRNTLEFIHPDIFISTQS